MKSYKEYASEIVDGVSLKEIVNNARKDYSIQINLDHKEEDGYDQEDVPFNLERIYVDELIDKRDYTSASKILTRMRKSYTDPHHQNFIELYEYHLKAIHQSSKITEEHIIEAKKEFNEHTIMLVSVIVGVITIFGTATETLKAKNFEEAFYTFLAISGTIIFLIFTIFEINKKVKK